MATVVRNKRSVYCIIWLITIFLLTITRGNAQRGSINLQKTVVIAAGPVQLDSLLRLINQQTGARFSLNTKKFPASKKIYIKSGKQSINSLLLAIRQSTGVYYAVLGDHIILLDNPPAGFLPKPAVVKNKQATVTRQKIADQHNQVDTVSIMPLNSPIQVHYTPYSTIIVPADVKKSAAPISKPSSAGNSIKEKRSSGINVFIKGGMATEDVFYCSPTIQAGLPYFYGIASWNTNFNISGFRYGIGFSIPVKDDWKLHVQATTGKLPSSSFDTTVRRLESKSALHRVAFMAETHISDRFTIQFGPTVNIMRLAFDRNGEQVAPGLSEDNANKNFHLLRPLYTIYDNYAASSSQATKIWIGLQVAIFYNINLFKRE